MKMSLIFCLSDQHAQIMEHIYKAVDGYMVLYSFTNRKSLEYLNEMLEKIASIKQKHPADLPMIIIGNKTDLFEERTVDEKEGLEVAKHFNIPHFTMSAKKNENIDLVFNSIIKYSMGCDYKDQLKQLSEGKKISKIKNQKCSIM
jgi:GTPase SAR1 family protein